MTIRIGKRNPAATAGLLMLLLALALAQVPSASAGSITILSFGETAAGSIDAIRSGSTTTIQTHNGNAVAVTITSLDGAAFNGLAYLKLLATSAGAAVTTTVNLPFPLPAIHQITEGFTGSFSITQNADGTGTNYLSGLFVGYMSGPQSGAAGALLSASPPLNLTFTSDVIQNLGSPNGLAFAISNITSGNPNLGLNVASNTIESFSGQTSATFSASVPEPASVFSLTVGALGLVGYQLRRRSALAA